MSSGINNAKKKITVKKRLDSLEAILRLIAQDTIRTKNTLYGSKENNFNGFLKAYDDLDTRTISLYRLLESKKIITEKEFIEIVKQVKIETKETVQAYMDARQGKRKKADDEVIEIGDELTINTTGTIDGKGFVGDKLDGLMLLAGGDHPFKGFSDTLIGKKNGDKVEFSVTVPKDCLTKEWAGRLIHYKVTILCVKTQIKTEDSSKGESNEKATTEGHKKLNQGAVEKD